MHDVQKTRQVCRYERLEVLRRVIREGLGAKDAGVIDQNVDGLEAGQGRLDDRGGRASFADVATRKSDRIGTRNLGELGHFPGSCSDIETPFNKRLHDSRADPLRNPGHYGCLPRGAHACLPHRSCHEDRADNDQTTQKSASRTISGLSRQTGIAMRGERSLSYN